MKVIKTVEAEGLTLCQDITKIIKDEFKGVAFPKGHVVTAEDIPELLSIGKEFLYVWSDDPSWVHEEDAAKILYSLIAEEHLLPTEIKEGKIEAIANVDGLLKVDQQKLLQMNRIQDVAVATICSDQRVVKGQKVAGTRIIPLRIAEERLMEAEKLADGEPILKLLPFKKMKAGIVTTGSEVFGGLIKDTFTPVVKDKLADYPLVDVCWHQITDDKPDSITSAINKMLSQGAEIIFCTGGMSVDPDDRTPLGIKQTGADIITHGTPVLPGSMLMLAYLQGKPILGLPGGVMFSDRTVFDLLLPRLMAGDPISSREIASLGYGGYLI